MRQPVPLDILIEIFSWDLTKYALFRSLSSVTREAKTPYDGWDSLVAQGYRVKISKKEIKWYKNDKLHREGDLPAVEGCNGVKMWYCDGLLHRDGNLPALTGSYYGTKEWRQRGMLHRDGDLPALVNRGSKHYYKNGKKHRDGGLPAMEDFYGSREWWIDGVLIRKEG